VNPKVSVIVPVYNVSKFIERCVRTLFEQTFDSIEYIFVNDCTPDNSIEILKGIILEYPKRSNAVQIIEHETNRGLAAARNTGLFASKGDYIQHIDSDDFIELDMIELLYKKAVEENADIVVSDFIFDWGKVTKVYKQNHSANPIEFTKMLLSNEILSCIWNKLIKRDLYFNNNIFGFENVDMGEDYVLITRLSYHANKISKINKALYHYNQMNMSAYTKSYSPKTIGNLLNALKIINDFFNSKHDSEKFKVSVLQGQLRKKIALYMSSSQNERNLISNHFLESNRLFSNTKLSLHERITFCLANAKTFDYLSVYLNSYNYIIELIQIIKGRR
jgi:glycosyltransferase involved in cell wall biosynthesis